jgi:integrase
VKPSGQPWKKSDHSRLFARAAKKADLNPNEVTIYALRHSSIVRQLLAGVPVRVVAVNHDTSIAMIERTYSRYIGDHADALARVALLDIGEPGGKVMSIAAAR